MAKITELPLNEDGIATVLGVLKQQFGDRFQTGQSIREQHGHTTTWLTNQSPDGVVFARSKDEGDSHRQHLRDPQSTCDSLWHGYVFGGACECARWRDICGCQSDEPDFGGFF